VAVIRACHAVADGGQLTYCSAIYASLSPLSAACRLPLSLCHAVDLDKVAAAQEVLDRVAAHSPACRLIVSEMLELIDGYIELAATPPPAKDSEEMPFPSHLRRSRQ
jgi:hypothetical protein